MRHKRNALAIGMAAVLSLALMAGCLGDQDLDSDLGPKAMLEVDREDRFTGERFHFNASGSDAEEGNITDYRVDFGDGEHFEASSQDEAYDIEHAYSKPGVYMVTLTVTAGDERSDANDTDVETDEDSLEVRVHDRDAVSEILAASPLDNESAGRAEQEFVTHENITGLELDLEVQSLAPLGSSRLVVRILDPNGDEVARDNVTVDAGETGNISMTVPLAEKGTYTAVYQVDSGATSVTGELRTYYGKLSPDVDGDGPKPTPTATSPKPTGSPTATPTTSPTSSPTTSPTSTPTSSPTSSPTTTPTSSPTTTPAG